ncbi:MULTISPECIES: nitroreductase family protein [unclassified Lentimicrobium]|uniref:nitroreductase family protein n=1 Tax=unclassified Lentimicrobium TaxID=2677434 RepID=UPI001552F1E8|nr:MULTISPECIES: nitroreductase family protein [unclassified Lentimicrobium]NPD45685.1 nitroreductase family protein [Lentimicrobium sp. S6]NPD85564.1 nitroreductase family protein [Lentimicrobium sp. L6]
MDKLFQIIKESKRVKTVVSLNELSQHRWSPRSFDEKEVEMEKLMSMMEAGRWSASAFNEQPWRFIIGFKGDDTFNKMVDTMVEFNQNWAKNAPVLILNICKNNFTHNNTINDMAKYDVGQAVASYCLEAVHQGLTTHQMSGFDAKKADERFNLGEAFSSLSITALGYLGKPDALPEELFKVELQNRMRNQMEKVVFTDELNKTPFTL